MVDDEIPDESVETVDIEAPEDGPFDGAIEVAPLPGEIPWQEEGREKLTIAFGGGKGGAGRSLLVANMGIFLARLGWDVAVADLDPGGSNLHTYVGLDPLLPTPGQMLRSPGPTRVEAVHGTSLCLCRPPRSTADRSAGLRASAYRDALELDVDVLLMDLGAAADPLTLDAFLQAEVAVVVIVPEPVGLERAYSFLRAALYRRLLHGDDDPAVVARAVLSADQVGELITPADLVATLQGAHAEAAEAIRARVLAFNPRILVNQCRSREDMEMLDGIASAIRRRWGVIVEPLGAIEYDDAAWNAARSRRPLLLERPGSGLGQRIERVARRLLAGTAYGRGAKAY